MARKPKNQEATAKLDNCLTFRPSSKVGQASNPRPLSDFKSEGYLTGQAVPLWEGLLIKAHDDTTWTPLTLAVLRMAPEGTFHVKDNEGGYTRVILTRRKDGAVALAMVLVEVPSNPAEVPCAK
jgi:hypothetical protein